MSAAAFMSLGVLIVALLVCIGPLGQVHGEGVRAATRHPAIGSSFPWSG